MVVGHQRRDNARVVVFCQRRLDRIARLVRDHLHVDHSVGDLVVARLGRKQPYELGAHIAAGQRGFGRVPLLGLVPDDDTHIGPHVDDAHVHFLQ